MTRSISLDLKGSVSEADYAFAQGLAAAKPLEVIADEMGMTIQQARKKAKNANVLAVVVSECLTSLHGLIIPRSLRVLQALVEDELYERSINDAKSLKTKKKIPVPVSIRLQAVQTALKLARLEEIAPPAEVEDIDAASPDRLRDIMHAIEGKLSELATPVGDPKPDAGAADAGELPIDYNVLD